MFASEEKLIEEITDYLQPAISRTRRYQTLQAYVNCTRRSLLPDGLSAHARSDWEVEIRRLEAEGVK